MRERKHVWVTSPLVILFTIQHSVIAVILFVGYVHVRKCELIFSVGVANKVHNYTNSFMSTVVKQVRRDPNMCTAAPSLQQANKMLGKRAS